MYIKFDAKDWQGKSINYCLLSELKFSLVDTMSLLDTLGIGYTMNKLSYLGGESAFLVVARTYSSVLKDVAYNTCPIDYWHTSGASPMAEEELSKRLEGKL